MSDTPDSEDPLPTGFDARFSRLVNAVLDKKAILKEIIVKHGGKNLYDYAKDYMDVNLLPPLVRRQDEVIGLISRMVGEQLGSDVQQSVARQLKKYYYVSTADHHGPITSQFFLSSNLLASAPYFEHGDPVFENVIVLACANVSLNNSSFPRGLLYTSYANDKLNVMKVAFSPAADRLCPVYNFRPYTQNDIERAKKDLRQQEKEKLISPEVGSKMTGILEEIYDRKEVYESKSYSEQITKTNFHLWKKFFNNGKALPNLIYFPIEDIVNRLLIEFHLSMDTTVTHMLFDPDYDVLFSQYFDGIQGAFSLAEKRGTYLFWALPPGAKYRIQLWKQGNELVSEDGTYRVELTPDKIRTAIESHELIPAMLMCYIVLSFYYGLKCLGGFSQVNYLTYMKNAYLKMQVDRGNYRSTEVCARAQTKELCGDVTIIFAGGPSGEMIPATGLDLILYGTEKTWPNFLEVSKTITIKEALYATMPEFYRIVYPESERLAELNDISSADITCALGLDKKIKPCVYVR